MTWPLVSIIIPNYNYARYLPQAIDSILVQTYPQIEVVVVDDGSCDDSVAVVERYGKRVRLLRQQNQGVAVARNNGARISSGQYLAFLDADDYWMPTKLERQIERFQNDPELGLVYCGVDEFYEDGSSCMRQEGLEGWVAQELLLARRAAFFGGGSGFVVPQALFEEIGGFDEQLSTSADWDLAYRVAALRRFGFVSEMLLKYRVHQSNMHTNVIVMEHDMLISYAKAFAQAPIEVQRLRKNCYARLHLILAGSYFHLGQYRRFGHHALKSLWLAPMGSMHFFSYPWRRLMQRG